MPARWAIAWDSRRLDRRGLAELAASVLLVDLLLNLDVGGGFALEVAGSTILVELLGQRLLDVAWASDVSLDQVAVIAIRQPKQACQVGRGRRVQSL